MNPQSKPGTASPTRGGTYPLKDRLSFVWLILAFAISIFSNSIYVVAIAVWLAPVFMLRFLRTQRALLGLLIGFVASAAAFSIYWRPAFPSLNAVRVGRRARAMNSTPVPNTGT